MKSQIMARDIRLSQIFIKHLILVRTFASGTTLMQSVWSSTTTLPGIFPQNSCMKTLLCSNLQGNYASAITGHRDIKSKHLNDERSTVQSSTVLLGTDVQLLSGARLAYSIYLSRKKNYINRYNLIWN